MNYFIFSYSTIVLFWTCYLKQNGSPLPWPPGRPPGQLDLVRKLNSSCQKEKSTLILTVQPFDVPPNRILNSFNCGELRWGFHCPFKKPPEQRLLCCSCANTKQLPLPCFRFVQLYDFWDCKCLPAWLNGVQVALRWNVLSYSIPQTSPRQANGSTCAHISTKIQFTNLSGMHPRLKCMYFWIPLLVFFGTSLHCSASPDCICHCVC